MRKKDDTISRYVTYYGDLYVKLYEHNINRHCAEELAHYILQKFRIGKQEIFEGDIKLFKKLIFQIF